MIFPAIKPPWKMRDFPVRYVSLPEGTSVPPGAPNRVEQRHSGVVQQCHGANVTRFHRAAIHPQHILSCCRRRRTDVTGRANHFLAQKSPWVSFKTHWTNVRNISQRLKSCNWFPHDQTLEFLSIRNLGTMRNSSNDSWRHRHFLSSTLW